MIVTDERTVELLDTPNLDTPQTRPFWGRKLVRLCSATYNGYMYTSHHADTLLHNLSYPHHTTYHQDTTMHRYPHHTQCPQRTTTATPITPDAASIQPQLPTLHHADTTSTQPQLPPSHQIPPAPNHSYPITPDNHQHPTTATHITSYALSTQPSYPDHTRYHQHTTMHSYLVS